MRRLASAIGLALIVAAQTLAAPSTARESRFLRGLRLLAPEDRLVQLCDFTAMQRIGKEYGKKYRPDRAVADAATESRVKDHTVKADGGAFRSKDKWYSLSYTCTAAPDHLTVTSFKYKVGDEIPEAKWKEYGLWE
jgi:hypothetical protein